MSVCVCNVRYSCLSGWQKKNGDPGKCVCLIVINKLFFGVAGVRLELPR